jgi:pimeloyl-ACP methyl ester carboxylesterase
MLLGYLYEPLAEASDAQKYPPPGEMVDVGGYQLHIDCRGTGSPTVVIDAGWGDWSTAWEAVQAEVSKTTRACTYDRAGTGWSEPGPLPRDAAQYAKELRVLLKNAGVPGPYVMVGHSMGGLTVRVFAHDDAADVAGVVLIDSMSPRQFTQSPTAPQTPSDSTSQARSFPAVSARFGLVRLISKPLGFAPDTVSNVQAYYSRIVRTQNVQAYISEGQGMVAGGVEAGAVTSFGDLPLVVLSARHNGIEGWQEWQTEMLRLSSDSRQLFAESDHNIHLEAPDAAVSAIIGMVDLVRATALR